MGDPIRELHTALLDQNLISGDEANFDNFKAGMADPDERRGIYDFIKQAKPDMVDMDFAAFDSTFTPVDGKKKTLEVPTLRLLLRELHLPQLRTSLLNLLRTHSVEPMAAPPYNPTHLPGSHAFPIHLTLFSSSR